MRYEIGYAASRTGEVPKRGDWRKVERIELDGRKVSDVFACDDEEGWVDRYQSDENGRVKVLDRGTENARRATEHLTGEVVVTVKP